MGMSDESRDGGEGPVVILPSLAVTRIDTPEKMLVIGYPRSYMRRVRRLFARQPTSTFALVVWASVTRSSTIGVSRFGIYARHACLSEENHENFHTGID